MVPIIAIQWPELDQAKTQSQELDQVSTWDDWGPNIEASSAGVLRQLAESWIRSRGAKPKDIQLNFQMLGFWLYDLIKFYVIN